MAAIPGFLLKALYVKDSLKNRADGFEFQLKNELGPARIIGALPLKVDRKPAPMADCSFIHEGQEIGFEDVTAENSVLMRKGEAVTVRVQGPALRPGRHHLDIGVKVKNMGPINFSVNDRVQ